jgi:hypothetical protein
MPQISIKMYEGRTQSKKMKLLRCLLVSYPESLIAIQTLSAFILMKSRLMRTRLII